jgi:hypothetical protein
MRITLHRPSLEHRGCQSAREASSAHPQAAASGHAQGVHLVVHPLIDAASLAQALPRMRLRLVLQTGQVAFAIRVPLSLTRTSPEACRLALHFTQ